MKFKTELISTIVLWIGMIVSFLVFVLLYFYNLPDPLLYYLYGIFIVTLITAVTFSVARFIKGWKNNKRPAIKTLIFYSGLLILLLLGYLSGDNATLNFSETGEGIQNLSFFMKLTDMWLYTIYTLLGLTIIAVFGGILWSYIKKRN